MIGFLALINSKEGIIKEVTEVVFRTLISHQVASILLTLEKMNQGSQEEVTNLVSKDGINLIINNSNNRTLLAFNPKMKAGNSPLMMAFNQSSGHLQKPFKVLN